MLRMSLARIAEVDEDLVTAAGRQVVRRGAS